MVGISAFLATIVIASLLVMLGVACFIQEKVIKEQKDNINNLKELHDKC